MRRIGPRLAVKLALLAALSTCAACTGSDADPDNTLDGDGTGGDRSSGTRSGAGSGGSGASDPLGGDAPAGGAARCTPDAVGTRTLYRLTPRQYDNTIADLLGLTGSWGAGFPADPVVDGFANGAATLLVSPLLADKLRDAAEDIASRVELSRLAACASTVQAGAADPSCTRELVRGFGERAFRRPLAEADLERYTALAESAGSFEAGARLLVTAMLQSPHFLYRRELGTATADGTFALDDFEVASELSYVLWQSMPDEALFAAARAGELRTPEQISAATLRMLEAPAAHTTVRAFVLEWLGLGALPTVPKDPERFPQLDAALRASMLREVERFVDHTLLAPEGSLSKLLTEPTSFVDDALAAHYGVTVDGVAADASGLHPIALGTQERAGILTLAGTMMLHARSNDSSPVHRGRLVRERLLCQVPPPPPPGIVVQPPPMDPQKTTRERYAAHSELQPCAGCHVLMDPIGFGFERFDGIGRYRTVEENGQPIEVHGEILHSERSDGAFDGTEELMAALADSAEVRACVASKWLRFAYGLHENAASRCVSRPLVDALAEGELTVTALVQATTGGAHLRLRRSLNTSEPGSEPAPGDAGAGGGAGSAGSAGAAAGTGGDAPVAGEGGAGEGGAGPVELDDALELELVVNNDYGSGYCHTWRVTNQGDAALTWQVPIELDGTLMQNWESEVTGSTGAVIFTGASHNRTLEPGSSAQFGFCVTR